jgi:hypothetical protein
MLPADLLSVATELAKSVGHVAREGYVDAGRGAVVVAWEDFCAANRHGGQADVRYVAGTIPPTPNHAELAALVLSYDPRSSMVLVICDGSEPNILKSGIAYRASVHRLS